MDLETRLKISDILITEFDRAVELAEFDNLEEVRKQAYIAKMKMQMFYKRHGEPIELFKQIERMEEIINKAELLHTKQ